MKKFIDQLFNPNNDFFFLTQGAKRLPHISLSSFILPVVFIMAGALITKFLLAPLMLGEPSNVTPWVRQIFGLYFMFGMGIIIIFLWVRFFEGRPIFTLGFTKNGALKDYFSGFGIGMLMVTIVVGITALYGNIELAEESPNTTGIDSLFLVLVFLGGYIIQGASEEILSRGWMMQVIGARYWPWLGVILSSLLFAILHLGNRGITVLPVVNLILFGLFMALYVLKDSNLWAVCGWHTSWNWMLGNVYGLSVSGSGEKVTIFDLNTSGNELISGGGFGPEGSLVTSAILLIGILLLGLMLMNRKYKIKSQNDKTINTDE